MNQLPDGDVDRLHRELGAPKNRALNLEHQFASTRFIPLSPLQDAFSGNAFVPSHNAVQDLKTAALARSKSNLGFAPSMGPTVMLQDVNLHALRRQKRALSQQSPASQSMSRSFSNRSEAAMPFRQAGPIAPLSASPTSAHFFSSHLDLVNQQLPSVEENGALPEVGIDPSVYIANAWDSEGQPPSYLATTGTNLFPHDPYTRQISTCPSMVSGSSLNEGPTPLTRQNSSFGSPVGMNMMRLASSQSFVSDEWSNQDLLFPGQLGHSQVTGKSCVSDQVLMGMGASLPEAHPQKYSSSPSNGNLFLSSPLSASMDRSESNTSISSAKSTASHAEQRAKEARARVLQNSKSMLAPKPSQDTEGSNDSQASASASDSSTKENKVLPKNTYRRPKHPKVFCNLCSDHPEGFRGDHELRRHINAKHEGIVKKFVCRDPATVGIVSNVAVQHPLSKCKACTSGKQYGAYYNAAAHLRRTHFKPKVARGKNKGANDERRGGKGGGDWPCMGDLKAWFEEVHVAVNQVPALSDLDDDDDIVTQTIDIASGSFPIIDGTISPFGPIDNGSLPLGDLIDPVIGLPPTSVPMAPLSSTSVSFGYLRYPEDSPMGSGSNEYTFSDHGAPAYGSAMPSNSMASSTFPELNQIGIVDGDWDVSHQ